MRGGRVAAGRAVVLMVASCTVAAEPLPEPAALLASSWGVTGQVGGPTSAVAVQGTTAFAAVGFRVVAYDLTTPTAPREVGSSAAFADLVLGVAVAGPRAYVAAGRAGLQVLDVADPAQPELLGTWDSPGSAEAVAIAGTTAYLADGPFGLRVVDVSDPAHPAPQGAAFDMRFAYDVAVTGGHAFVAAAGAGLLVADVRDPAHPTEVATLGMPGFARSVVLSGSFAYVAAQWGGVRIVSVRDPAHPVEVAAVATRSWAYGVALAGPTLFVADGSQGMRAYDVSDPAQPRSIGSYPVAQQHAGAVAAAAGRAVVAAREEGLHVVDVQSPTTPTRLAVVSQLADARAVTVVGDVAYVAAASQGLRVVDLASGAREIAALPMPGGFAYATARLGENTVAVSSTWGVETSGIWLYDITDPRQPRQVKVFTGPTLAPMDLAVQGALMAAGEERGVQLLDVANPQSPSILSFLDLSGVYPGVASAGSVAFAGSVLCFAYGSAGLLLVDVADPGNPTILGAYKPPSLASAQAVASDGRYAYVLPGNAGFHVVDISDPRNPRTVTVFGGFSGGERASVFGTVLYAACGGAGVATVDISDPMHPALLAAGGIPGYARRVHPANGRVVVAGGGGGLFVLQPAPAAALANPGASGTDAPVVLAPAPDADRTLVEAALRTIAARQTELAARIDAERAAHDRDRSLAPAATTARTLVVTSTADSGPGTLRDALATAGPGGTITFDPAVFPPTAPATIRPLTELPSIWDNRVTVDASNAGVVLDGSGAQKIRGLNIMGNYAKVMGLQIVRCAQGIMVAGSHAVIGGDRRRGAGPTGEGNVISGNQSGINFSKSSASDAQVIGNFIGTDGTGTQPLGTQSIGVLVFPGGPDIVIGGGESWEANVIAGNTLAEVFLQQGAHTTIAGNLIGTDPTGTRRVGSAAMGLGTGGYSSDNLVTGNVIVARQQGVIISDTGSSYNQIVGNRIGLGRDGAQPQPVNPGASIGVAISQPFNRVADNVIAGNTQWGLVANFWGTHDSVITGNLIGTDPSGTEARPNGLPSWGGGMSLSVANRTFIGGATREERNVISGNAGPGLVFSGPGPDGNFVLGNLIGCDASAAKALGNARNGVEFGSATANFLQGNVLAWNAGAGVWTAESRATRIRRNSIHANGGGGVAVPPGSSTLPAPPTVSSVTAAQVAGSACAGCTIELFSDTGGQGRLFEGEVVADGAGAFSFVKASGFFVGPNLTATVTDRTGSTSPFSAPVPVPPRPPRRRLGAH